MTSYLPRTMTTTVGRTTLTSTLAGGTLDLLDLPRDQTPAAPPPAFPPFRFEPRRSRIDWRLLHGVDINAIVRDVDLDTLEKIVSIVAFGDIEAEDTRHLTELNFIKVFRLSQLMIEYLLYVQDCLQSTNSYLQQDRVHLEKYIAAARIRLRELESGYRMSKRELRRARKTVKTYEMMAALGKLPGQGADAAAAAVVKPVEAPAPAQPQVIKVEPSPVTSAMEAVLRKELSLLSDRLTRTQVECQQLRTERDEMLTHLRDIDAAMRNRGVPVKSSLDGNELRTVKEQLIKANSDFKMLKAEMDEVAGELARVQVDKGVLQEEKDKLLQELARNGSSPSGPEGSTPLYGMLQEAEKRNKSLVKEVEELTGEVNTLRKQLMKAMKDAAISGTTTPPQFVANMEDLQRQLASAESARAEAATKLTAAEQELANQRRLHNDDVRRLEEELQLATEQATELRRELLSIKASAPSSSRQGGWSKDAGGGARQQADHAAITKELEGAKRRVDELSQQVKALTQDLTGINMQNSDLRSRNNDLKQQLEGAWKLVGELHEQLAIPAANRDPATVGRVKQQVKEFEQVAERQGSRPELPPPPQPVRLTKASSINDSLPKPPVPTAITMVQQQEEVDFNNQSFKFSRPAVEPTGSTGTSVALDTPTTASQLQHKSDQGQMMVMVEPLPHVPARPTAVEMQAAKREAEKRVAGLTPDQLGALLTDELYVLTEAPYEYQEDDEEQFRAMLPHEVPEQTWVLSTIPRAASELSYAQQRFGAALLGQVDDLVTTFGVYPEDGVLTDREYAGLMMELHDRRNAALQRLGPDAGERAAFFRDALLTHLELAKRDANAAAGTQGLASPDPQEKYAAVRSLARGSKSNIAAAAAVITASGPPVQSESDSVAISREYTLARSASIQRPGDVPEMISDNEDGDNEDEPDSPKQGGAQAQAQALSSTAGSRRHPPPPTSAPSEHLSASHRSNSGTGKGGWGSGSMAGSRASPPPAASGYHPSGDLERASYAVKAQSRAASNAQSVFAQLPPRSPSRAPSDYDDGGTNTAATSLNASPVRQGSLGSRASGQLPQATAANAASGVAGSSLTSTMRSITDHSPPSAPTIQPAGSMNLSLRSSHLAPSPLDQSLRSQAQAQAGQGHTSPLNQSLRSPTAPHSPMNQSVRDVRNQSLQNTGSGHLAGTAKSGGMTGSMQGAVSALAMSLRSQGKASLRDYSAADFDEDDDDDDEGDDWDGPSQHGGGGGERANDEYKVDVDEEDDFDEGLPEPMFAVQPVRLTGPATGGQATDRPSGLNASLTPSRLARVTSADDDLTSGLPRTSGFARQPTGGPQHQAAEGKGGWAGGAAPIDSLKPALRVEDYADELGSIHSFHPSETTRSVAAGAAGASAFTSRAAVGWGSPTTTMRSQKGAGQAGQGSANLGGTGRWEDTIRTMGSVGAADEMQPMRGDDATSEASSYQQRPLLQHPPSFNMGGGGQGYGVGGGAPAPAPVPAPVATRLVRRDSFDTVSEVEYM